MGIFWRRGGRGLGGGGEGSLRGFLRGLRVRGDGMGWVGFEEGGCLGC